MVIPNDYEPVQSISVGGPERTDVIKPKNLIDQFEKNRKKASQKGILRSKCYFSYLSFTEYIDFSEKYLSKLVVLKSESTIC